MVRKRDLKGKQYRLVPISYLISQNLTKYFYLNFIIIFNLYEKNLVYSYSLSPLFHIYMPLKSVVML